MRTLSSRNGPFGLSSGGAGESLGHNLFMLLGALIVLAFLGAIIALGILCVSSPLAAGICVAIAAALCGLKLVYDHFKAIKGGCLPDPLGPKGS